MQVQTALMIHPQKSQVVFGTPSWEEGGGVAPLLHLHTCRQPVHPAVGDACTAVQKPRQGPLQLAMPSERRDEVGQPARLVEAWGGAGEGGGGKGFRARVGTSGHMSAVQHAQCCVNIAGALVRWRCFW